MPSRPIVILSVREESRHKPLMRHSVVNTSRREGCSTLTFESYVMNNIPVISHLRWLFPPFGAYGTTFPPLKRWDNKAP